MPSRNIAHNLRLLLEKYRTLTDAAHSIGVNRQQLNKYLNGSSIPSAHTLNRIAKALDIEMDMLFKPAGHSEYIAGASLKLTTDLEVSMANTFNRAMARTMREEHALAQHCGDYLLYHRTAMSERHVHVSLIRIYQEVGKTYAKSLMALRQNGQPRTGIKTYKHGSLVFLNSGCLQILRMSGLNDGDTDLGLLVLSLPRFNSEKYLFGHTLTTSISLPGQIVPSKVIFQKVTGNPLQLFRKHCGAWSLEDPNLGDTVKTHFNSGMHLE
ncbi:helix-turn-helix domain-containing protein [Celeribacter sp. ULVN23_4]